MGWRTVVVTQHAKISISMHNLVVHTDIEVNHIPVKDVQLLIIDSLMVMISARAVAEISRNRGKILFVGMNGNPTAQLTNVYAPSKTAESIMQQVNWHHNQHLIDVVWTKIVANKILNQIKVAEFYGYDVKDLLSEYDKLQLNDVSNREAVIARKYFQLVMGDDFSRSDVMVVNDALNYGYSLLLALTNLAIVSNGQITEIGIHHNNEENSFNLGSDLMEPFRPLVDQWVLAQKFQEFTPEVKYGIIQILDIKIRFNGHNTILRNAINEHVANCLRYLNQNTEEIRVEVEIPNEVSSNAFNDHV